LSAFFCLFAAMIHLSIIAAVSQNNAIGRNNKLLWSLKDDMRLFVKTTSGHAVIMGRKTFESLKGPLPKRQNIVVSRRSDYNREGVEVAHSLDAAIGLVKGQTAFIIGGGTLYAESLNSADTLYISHVEDHVEDADTFFPEIDPNKWEKIESTSYSSSDRNEKGFTFCKYTKVK
jgi:dihydrofolate reductase